MIRGTKIPPPQSPQQANVSREGLFSSRSATSTLNPQRKAFNVSLLTAGRDKPYALGLAGALLSAGVSFDFLGSDLVDGPELHGNGLVRFLKIREQREDATAAAKVARVLRYYARLIRYAATAQPAVFHILWNNKLEFFDRTLLMLYYKSLGKKIALTVHNVNAGERDGNDSFLNRLSLRIQYKLSDHIFVHTEKMKNGLMADFYVAGGKVSVIPFGINNTVPNTALTSADAKRQLALSSRYKAILFFGNIAPYKGLEYLVEAFGKLAASDPSYRLIIAGRPKWSEDYWLQVKSVIDRADLGDRIIARIEYVPDEQTELYMKAADILVLPYTHVFQSGVLFLGYNFGLPAVVTDVGSLKEEIIEGETGFVCSPEDASSLAEAISRYFECDLFRELENRRPRIKQYANERYSWKKVAVITKAVYLELTR